MLTIVDAQRCYNDLLAYRSSLLLDYSRLPAGTLVYTKYTQYPYGLASYLAGLGHVLCPLDSAEFPESLTAYIVRDLWQQVSLPASLTVYSNDPLLIPALKGLRNLSVDIKVIACSNLKLFHKEGFKFEWLTNYSKSKLGQKVG